MPRNVRYRIEADTSEELQKAVAEYQNQYPYIGYDTRLITTTQEDDKYVAYMNRLSSCD